MSRLGWGWGVSVRSCGESVGMRGGGGYVSKELW